MAATEPYTDYSVRQSMNNAIALFFVGFVLFVAGWVYYIFQSFVKPLMW